MNKFIGRWLLIQFIVFIIQILITFKELVFLDIGSIIGCFMGFTLISSWVGCFISLLTLAIEFICKTICKL